MNITFFKFLKYCGAFLVLAALSASIAFNVIQKNQNSVLQNDKKELTEINKNLSESITADRKNELAGTIIEGQERLSMSDRRKKGFFSRFFKKDEGII